MRVLRGSLAPTSARLMAFPRASGAEEERALSRARVGRKGARSSRRPLRPGAFDEDRFDRFRRIPEFDLKRIREARVLLVGCGALGNEAAKDLALAGVSRLDLVDPDCVVPSNLPRCVLFTNEDAQRRRNKADAMHRGLKRLAPDLMSMIFPKAVERLPDDLISRYDLILGGLDNLATRLHLNARAWLARRPYVDGALQGLIGKVQVIRPPHGPCLECSLNATHARIVARRFSCTGNEFTFVEPIVPAEITTTSLIGAVMAQEALKLLSGRPELCLEHLFYFDGRRNVAEVLEIPRSPECALHWRRRRKR